MNELTNIIGWPKTAMNKSLDIFGLKKIHKYKYKQGQGNQCQTLVFI